LCYHDLRPPPPATAAPVPDALPPAAVLTSAGTTSEPPLPPLAAIPAEAALAADAALAAARPSPTWPCTLCGTANDLHSDSCVGCGAGFLAALHGPSPGLTIPGLGDVGRLERTQRFLLAGGLVFLVLLVTVLLGLF
jgi:hypothetical protein